MMSGFKASVQNELNGFFAHLANQADLIREVSAQAFSKARHQFSHLAFFRLNQQLMHLVVQHRQQMESQSINKTTGALDAAGQTVIGILHLGLGAANAYNNGRLSALSPQMSLRLLDNNEMPIQFKSSASNPAYQSSWTKPLTRRMSRASGSL